jgi:2-dehydro-3-deoxyphosphooctonate aldolase (KDO 8-P synthase)
MSNNQYNTTWNLLDFKIGIDQQFFLIAGPCVVESLQLAIDTAGYLKELTSRLGINFVYKSSYDKANRSSDISFRGKGMEFGLNVLEQVKKQIKVPIITDVHNIAEIDSVASVVDILQTPAFLCRQTDFIKAVAACGKPVNIKKGQFLSPYDMVNVANKALNVQGHGLIMVCERGVSFGYNNLVSDMRSLVIMRQTNCPVIFDATHSVQLPGGLGDKSGGQREFVSVLSKAAVAVGISGLFIETHPDPENAMSDGPNSVNMYELPRLLESLLIIEQGSKCYEKI